MRYHFPGNIRELENTIERAVVMSRENVITTSDLPAGLSLTKEKAVFDPNDFTDSYTNKVAAFEIAMIDAALDIKNGNQSRAAELLGISERHLRSRMSKLNIINTKRR
jgi:two-component system NtrC family response regulator